jgi:RimJ/RimL family protein N-acetyltransferase
VTCDPVITTERLILRPWRPEDRAPFGAINADPAVTEFLLGPLSRDESDALAARIEAHYEQHGFTFWAVETVDDGAFIGMVGLAVVGFEAPFTPAVEVGWRLASDRWGRGYATEAARAAVQHGFDCLGLDEIVAFTVPANVRSRAVMERIGMTHDPRDDFAHPKVPADHPLSRHVLYRKRRA